MGLLLPGLAKAAAGDLDPSFGDGGRLEPGRSGPSIALPGAAGRYLFGTGGSLIGFTEFGDDDPNWGQGGTALGGPYVQQSSRGIVAGRTDGTIVRVNGNGKLDGAFGDNGHVYTGGMGGLTVQPDGSIIVVSGTSSGRGLTLRRYDPEGDLDTSFGANGAVTLFPPDRPGGISVAPRDAVVTPDGGIVATGAISYPRVDYPGALAVKVTSEGNPDPAFGGGDGIVLNFSANDPSDVELLDDGRLLVTGQSVGGSTGFSVSLLEEDGTPDTGFGSGGQAAVNWGTDPVPDCSRTRAWDATVDQEGRILLTGTVGQRTGCGSGYEDVAFFGVSRLLPDGALDTSFGNQGKVRLEFSSSPLIHNNNPASPRNASVMIDPPGNIIFAGQTESGMAVAKLEGGEGDGNGEGGDGSNGGGGVAGGVAAKGRVGLRVHRVLVPKTAGALIRRGVRVLASCEVRCKLVVNVDVSPGVANQLGLSTTRIARGTASTAANKRRWVVARLTPAAAETLRTYGGGGRLHIRVRAVGPEAQSATADVAG